MGGMFGGKNDPFANDPFFNGGGFGGGGDMFARADQMMNKMRADMADMGPGQIG